VGLTYTTALDRDLRRSAVSARRLRPDHLLLGLASLVAVLAIALAYFGRVAPRPSAGTAATQSAVTNLNAVADPRELEALFAPVFANERDRRFASSQLFQFVRSIREAEGSVPNAGAVLAVTVTSDAIDGTPGLVEYRRRLQEARERAATSRTSPPKSLPLLGAADLTAIKPGVIVRTPSAFARSIFFSALLYIAGFWAVTLCWWMRGFRGDLTLLAAAHLLTAVGFAVLVSRPDPLRDTLLCVRYVQGIGVGLAVCCAVSLVDYRKAAFLTLSYVPLIAALLLSAMLLLFGDGPRGSNAKVNLGPIQPIEMIRLLLALFLAGYFARRWEVLRQVRGRTIGNLRIPRWLNLPRAEYLLPVLIGVGAAVSFFFLQRDLGPALFLSCVFLAVYAIARGRVGMAVLGFGVLLAGFYLGYQLNVSSTLAARVHMWQFPWDNSVRGGDQIAQAVWAAASGGFFGTGLGLGDSRYLPAGHTDLVLAAIGEELGFAGLVAVAGIYLVIARRGFGAARRAASDYGFFLATTVTLFLVLPVLVMAAGTLGVIPLTGIVTPFLSYGGSAMVANFAALGILTAIESDAGTRDIAQPFRAATQYLGGVLAVAALALLAVLADVQVVRADAYVVKPHRGLQADGVRRDQYNQRVLDVIGLIPRGTVYDRTGLPLATSDDAVARRARGTYERAGLALGRSCRLPIRDRCYPLESGAFHLLGDARTRPNWSATNSSYIERDAQDRLRGFRRDYRELVPLLRHRHQPGHRAVKTLLAGNRDVTLTIDARLQSRLARIVSEAASKSRTGRAAAVVIDPDTGELLASASVPSPADDRRPHGDGAVPDAWLDRARYGLYPPGSTFKVVTAAAALRRDASLSRSTFMCAHLPGGRVGARIPGWGVVRDDVLIGSPHGTTDMHDGLTRSCNAYFAQLALKVGAPALLETAAILGISVARDNTASRLRETLPHAGYGQGDIVATPLRMARVAAAIANGGLVRDVKLEAGGVAREPARLLRPEATALLEQSLRDAVLGGGARSLRSHPWRIAGKTGTAEVAGAPSHAWFIGFAPFGRADKRVAFAVVVESAGYGGRAAAPAAGEIVTAAAASGLVR
jgi:cell division protein FtsW (lipid II flippase)